MWVTGIPTIYSTQGRWWSIEPVGQGCVTTSVGIGFDKFLNNSSFICALQLLTN